MGKSEVYSWRTSPRVKMALELEARRQGASVAAVLDRIAQEWLDVRQSTRAPEETEQARLHAAAARTFGTISGGRPKRAELACEAVRQRLARRRER